MASTTAELTEKGIAHPPPFLAPNIHYETIMGSVAYGVSADTSDMDIYGFCIPPRDEIFPNLRGEIIGFGTQKQRFSSYQEHHLVDPQALAGKGRSHDLTIYNIVDYFQLVMKNNPNMIDSLFTALPRMVRDLAVLVEIRVVPTTRDEDGLALSSRNAYLSPEERERALALPRALAARDRSLLNGLEVDYFEEADFEPRVLAAAVRIGKTRLIDNVVLEGESS